MHQALPEPPSLRLPPIRCMVLLQGNNLAHHIINCPSPFLLLQGVKPSLHLYHKGCHPSHPSLPSLQGNHFPNQILLGNHMEYPISSLLLHGLVDMRVISIGELLNGWGLVLKIQLCLSLLTQDASQFPEYMDREVNPDFDFDDLHYLDIEQSDLNDPPSPSNEGLLSSHPHTPSIISQQSIHPPSTPGLDAA